MQGQAIEVSDQSQPSPLFSYVITQRATDKTRWGAYERPFDEFVQSLFRRGCPVGVKDGTGIVAAEMVDSSRLEDKNVLTVTAVILDIDGKLRVNGVETAQYVDPDNFLSKLPFRAVAHTSYNHSAELAKFRVIIPLRTPVSRDEFPRLWWWCYERTGKLSDPSCKNPSRMFYLPRRAETVDSALHWIRDIPGPYLSLQDVPPDYRIPTGEIPRTGSKAGLHVRNQTNYRTVDPHLVLDELVASPLFEWAVSCSTEVSREAWRGLATNLAALVVEDADMYEACSQAFHNLSCVDEARYDYRTCEKTFRDAVNSAQNVGPMTWGTLEVAGAPRAACQGHRERSPVAVARGAVSRRVRDQERRETAPAPRSSLPGPSPFIQEVPVWESSAPESIPVRVEGALVPSDAAPPAPPIGSDDGTGDNSNTWGETKNFVFDSTIGEWLQWDSAGNLVAQMSDKSFTRALCAVGYDRKTAEAFKCLCPAVSNRKYFYDRADRIVYDNGVPYLNMYRPTDLQPAPGDWTAVHKLLLNLCGGDLIGVEFVLDWLATPLQSIQNGKPWKTLTALIFQGQPGSGKGTLAALIRAMYGVHNTVELNQEVLDGRFNDMMAGKLFVLCNEVIASSNRADETFNKIKTWVADEKINVERKYGDRIESANTFNMIFMSNDLRPVLVPKDDRRYIVFASKKLDPEISDAIWTDMYGERKMVAAFYAALLTRPSKLVKSQMYETEARRELIRRTMPSWDKFVHAVAEDGWLSVSQNWVDSANPNGPSRVACERGDFVPMATVMAVYADFCRVNGIRAGSTQLVAAAFKDVIPEAQQVRMRLDRNPARGWTGIPMDAPDTVKPPPAPKSKDSSEDSNDVVLDYIA